VQVEEAGVPGAEPFADLALDLLNFVTRVQECPLEALKLGRNFGGRQLDARDIVVLGAADDQDAPTANAG
jgi:hypothetical protein